MEEQEYVCDIEMRVRRGREQFRYVCHWKLSSPGTEWFPTGKWRNNRAQAEEEGRKVRDRKIREWEESQFTRVGRLA